MKYRYKLKVTQVDGELKYMPMIKRFLFWLPLSVDTDIHDNPIYVEDNYDRAMAVIETHKRMVYKPKRKRLRENDILVL